SDRSLGNTTSHSCPSASCCAYSPPEAQRSTQYIFRPPGTRICAMPYFDCSSLLGGPGLHFHTPRLRRQRTYPSAHHGATMLPTIETATAKKAIANQYKGLSNSHGMCIAP